jgi:ISXO2-like transposase domain
MASSKKSMSAHQLHRMLGTSYEAAWFLFHRLREAANDIGGSGPIGGENKVVEADETYIGGKARNKAFGPPPRKAAVFTLVERGGEARWRHVADVTARTLRETIVTQADRKSYLMTDEALVYERLGKEFAGHGTVNHSADEYVRTGGFHHTNTVESFFASAPFMGSFTISARLTCIATSPKPISNTIPGPRMTRIAPTRYCVASRASGFYTGSLISTRPKPDRPEPSSRGRKS